SQGQRDGRSSSVYRKPSGGCGAGGKRTGRQAGENQGFPGVVYLASERRRVEAMGPTAGGDCLLCQPPGRYRKGGGTGPLRIISGELCYTAVEVCPVRLFLVSQRRSGPSGAGAISVYHGRSGNPASQQPGSFCQKASGSGASLEPA